MDGRGVEGRVKAEHGGEGCAWEAVACSRRRKEKEEKEEDVGPGWEKEWRKDRR